MTSLAIAIALTIEHGLHETDPRESYLLASLIQAHEAAQ